MELKAKSKQDLRILGSKLGLGNLTRMSQKELIATINRAERDREQEWRKWDRWKVISLLVTILLIPAIYWGIRSTFPDPVVTSPHIELAWYEEGSKPPTLVPLSKAIIRPTSRDVVSGQIEVPINIAINNRDKQPLRVVRVEMNYPKDIDVQSKGNPKLDRDNQLLVYEHDIGTLEPVDNFTPLETIDVLAIPCSSIETSDAFVIQTRDGVPLLFYLLRRQ